MRPYAADDEDDDEEEVKLPTYNWRARVSHQEHIEHTFQELKRFIHRNRLRKLVKNLRLSPDARGVLSLTATCSRVAARVLAKCPGILSWSINNCG